MLVCYLARRTHPADASLGHPLFRTAEKRVRDGLLLVADAELDFLHGIIYVSNFNTQ
jgi:hypothetical protein